jgi:ABC-type Fe2+-enterobactin transport system substrate-binding protein
MTKLLLMAAALSLVASGALAKTIANPPTEAQLKAFYAQCVKVAPEASVLCKCKEDAAPKLIDTAFMDVVIASMKGKPLAANYYDQYNNYIARSNQICKPEYM